MMLGFKKCFVNPLSIPLFCLIEESSIEGDYPPRRFSCVGTIEPLVTFWGRGTN